MSSHHPKKIQIKGSNGNELLPNADGSLSVSDILNTGGLSVVLILGAGGAEVKVGATPKADRKYVTFWSLDNGVSLGFAAGQENVVMQRMQVFGFPVGPDTHIYVKGDVAGKRVVVMEL